MLLLINFSALRDILDFKSLYYHIKNCLNKHLAKNLDGKLFVLNIKLLS